MEPVLTPVQMIAADRRTIAAGTNELALIERAGTAVAWQARSMLGGCYGRRVVVVCGKGNNGNDGSVAARVLAGWGVRVDLFQLEHSFAAHELARALDRCDLAIDAMYGTGFRGVLDGAAAIVDAELYRAPSILAVDIPSGVDGATGEIRGDGFISGAVLANATITFGALKPGLLFEPGRFHAGDVTVADIGIDLGVTSTWSWTYTDAAALPLERWPQEHKWTNAVMVIGGSPGMTGAPVMSAMAAQRSGAGMVVVGVPTAGDVGRVAPELVTHQFSSTPQGALDEPAADEIVDAAQRFGALVLGPGLGGAASTQRAVRSVVTRVGVPLVIDADALRALSGDHCELLSRTASLLPPAVLTPHDGEYEAIAGRPVGVDRVAAARWLADATQCVVLLKGPGTVVAGPNGFAAIVANGGSELATAGTGDVLCGIIAALCSKISDHTPDSMVSVAASAAWIHADAARRTGLGPSMTAGDLIATLAATMAIVRRGERPVIRDSVGLR